MNNDLIKRNSNFKWVESLRGIGAFLVFFSHLPIIFINDLGFIIGRIGVVIFLMMSGYLAVSSRIKYKKRDYLINRFLRMYPVYWVLLIIYVVLSPSVDIIKLLANITLFSKFIGQSEMLGASWMMPIQIIFFIGIAFMSKEILEKIISKSGNDILMRNICIIGIFSLILSILRLELQKPFPVAIALLLLVAILGIGYRYRQNKEEFIKLLMVFEVFLIFSVIIAYPSEYISYFIAYNMGIIFFILADYKKINFEMANKLGKISFTFFLSGEITGKLAHIFITKLDIIDNLLIFCLLQFIINIIFSFIITKYIENPLHKIFNNYMQLKKL